MVQKTSVQTTPQLGSIWDPTWPHFGRVLGAKMGPIWFKMGSKSSSKARQKMIRSWMALRSNFDGFWLPNGSQEPRPIFLKIPLNGVWIGLGPQDPPKAPQDPSRRPLGTDFGTQEASQEPSRRPLGAYFQRFLYSFTGKQRAMDGWMDGWMDGCMDAWMDGWMGGWWDSPGTGAGGPKGNWIFIYSYIYI